MCRALILFAFCLSLPTLCIGQVFGELPKLTPSYSENFTNNSTYPSMCFRNPFKDKNGRFWLQTCDPIRATTAIPLFQFDGYEFKFIQGPLGKLETKDWISGIYNKEALIGVFRNNNDNHLFLFDLESHQLKEYPLKTSGEVEHLEVGKDDRIFLSFVKKDSIVLYEWKNGELDAQGQFQSPVFRAAKNREYHFIPLYHDEKNYWVVRPNEHSLIRIDKKSNTIKEYNLSDLLSLIPNSHTKNHPLGDQLDVNVIPHSGGAYITINHFHGGLFFNWDSATDTFIPLDPFPEIDRSENIFQDQKGNFLFLYRNKQNEYQAVLQEPSGKQFDYSDFFKEVKTETIKKLLSFNFKKELVMCTTKGVWVHKVKSSDAIRHFLPDNQIRAMAELGEERFLISIYDRTVIVDVKTNSIEPFNHPDCLLGWSK